MKKIVIDKIREIQVKEGFEPCFRTKELYCSYSDNCCWASICLEEFCAKPTIIFDVVK